MDSLVTVECTDAEGVNSLTQNASLYITVTDVNDHSPTFDKSAYNGRVAENSPTAEVHLSSPMRVTDADSGTNALVTFSVFDLGDEDNTSDSSVQLENGSRLFRIDPRSGRIWTVIPLDCESKSQYTLLVIATDSGLPNPKSGSATVYITVEDENDNAPEFTSSHYMFEGDLHHFTACCSGHLFELDYSQNVTLLNVFQVNRSSKPFGSKTTALFSDAVRTKPFHSIDHILTTK
ncbi:hypothetical protein P879_05356 [Paragonimus westermani]|uniref:Cadherin domain-containing protein n=1 Tax=Paragonimus westermani TaxID=34504 RepID=A0A8T0DXH1_9TREM|nr:hypothetical protein P879_05356 [Paragonimus westermani]